jgi:hypothetical protein
LIFLTLLEAAKMWFAKWFGARKQPEADEPARFASPDLTKPAQPVAQSAARSQPRPAPKPGFDPYNSGSFERRNAWERVNRR